MSEYAYLNLYTREAMAKTLALRDEKIKRLQADNAKLRELVRDMMRCITYDHDCRDCLVNGEHCDASILDERAKELGIPTDD